MTIRIEHLTFDPTNTTYLSMDEGSIDVTTDPTHAYHLLAVVRHIMRERSDCRFIPRIVRAYAHPVNKWGHNLTVEVQYTNRWRAVYAARTGATVTNVMCYMD